MPSTAEAARDREQELGGQPTAPAPAPGVDFAGMMQQLRQKRQALEEREAEFVQREQAGMAPLREGLAEQVRQPLPTPPGVPTLPKPPNMALRPFLEGLPGEAPVQTLNNTLFGLGLMAQMAVGISKNYAQGALASYAGALNGWARGDRARAESEWLDWQARFKEAQTEYYNRRRAYQDIMDRYAYDLDRRRIEMQIKAAEFEEERRGLDMAAKSADRFFQELHLTGTLMEKIDRDRNHLNLALMLKEMDIQSKRENLLMMQQMHRDNAAMLRETKMIPAPAGGSWYNRKTNETQDAIEAGQLRAAPKDWFRITHQDQSLLDFIATTKPQIERLKEVTKKLAAEHPGENLMRAVELGLQNKLAASPDLREMILLNRDAMIELTRAIGGSGQLRVGVMKALERDVGIKTTDTVETGMRALNTLDTALQNRRASILREYERGELQSYGPGGGSTPVEAPPAYRFNKEKNRLEPS